MTVGHPDFLGAVSPAPPQLVTTLGPFAAGAAWGPTNVLVPNGGSYHLVILPTNTSNYVCTDVIVNHLDSAGNTVYQDFFGGVLAGNGLIGSAGNANAAVCRGNIYGVTLQIAGNAAASAFLNTVIPGHAFTATGLSVRVYTTPFALNDPEPKVTSSAPALFSFVSGTPNGLLAIMNATPIAAATLQNNLPLLAYSGEVTTEILQTGPAIAADVILTLSGWGVAFGSGGAVTIRRYSNLTANTPFLFRSSLPSLLWTYSFNNTDPANATTVYLSVSAGKAA